MKSVLTLTSVAFVLAGCATTTAQQVTEQSLLADARARSERYCSTIKAGCELTVSAFERGWSVHVKPITLSADGVRFVGIDSDDMYFYDHNGRFTSALRGY